MDVAIEIADIGRLIVCGVALVISMINWRAAKEDHQWTRRSLTNGSRELIAKGMVRAERLRAGIIGGLLVIALWAVVIGRPYEPATVEAIIWIWLNAAIQMLIAASVALCGWKDRTDRDYLLKWRKPVVIKEKTHAR